MHPILFRVFGLSLHSYGLLLAIAFLVGIQLFVSRGVRRGLPEEKLHTVSLLLLVLAIVGGRGLFVLTHWSDYARDPLGALRLWEGGLILYGGYILSIAGGIWYLRRAGLPVWRVADAIAPSAAIGIGIGRIGCFLNGCCYGLPTKLPWGVHFPPGSYSSFTFPGEALQPSQLYLAASGAAIFTWLIIADRKPHFDGWLFWSYVAVDAAARFLIDFTRYYDQTSYLGNVGPLAFNMNQVLSGALILTSIIMLSVLSRRPAAAVPLAPASPETPSAVPPEDSAGPEAATGPAPGPVHPGS